MIYVINMLLILVYAFILKPDRGTGKNQKAFCILVGIQLTCISGFQYGVGTDYESYLRIYETVQGLDWEDLIHYYYWNEPIFLFYTKIIAVLFKENFIPYFFGMALVTVLFLMKAIYERRENTVWTVYIYLSLGLFYVSMNQIRQMAAISIVLYSIRFIEERNWKKYVIWILIAAGIHNSALIMLPCYFITMFKLQSRKKTMGILIVLSICVYFLSPFIVDKVLVNTQYGHLLSRHLGETDNMVINLLFRSALLVGCILYIKPVLEKNKKYVTIYGISIIAIIFQILSVYAASAARITTYFYAVFIFLIPVAINAIPRWKMRILAKTVIVVGMLAYHIFYLYRKDFIAYQSVLSLL